MEPLSKKQKLDEDPASDIIDVHINNIKCSKNNLKAVISDDFLKPIPHVKVYAGHVKNPKDLSKIILILNEKVPLGELSHLKRVRKNDVLLCPVDNIEKKTTIQDFILCNVFAVHNMFEYFKVIEVPQSMPKLKKQYNNLLWSCNFHPNKYYEKLASDSFFFRSDLKIHRMFMEMTFEVARWYLQGESSTNFNAAVIGDMSIGSVVAASFCNGSHPVKHSTMIAIDNVAKTQNGGAWGTTNQNDKRVCISGIDTNLKDYLSMKFHVSFGARAYVKKEDSDSNTEDGPYLCTGYEAYILREPCIMCSMALVHARIKRVFFCFDNVLKGGLKSRTKLQTIPSLNHHFEVFTGFL